MFHLDIWLFVDIMIGGMSVGLGMIGAVSFVNAASIAPAAPPPGQGANRALAATASPSGKDKMDPRLLAHFMGAGVPDEIIEKLSTAGVKSLALVASLGWNKKGFELTPITTPSKGYFEMKVDEVLTAEMP